MKKKLKRLINPSELSNYSGDNKLPGQAEAFKGKPILMEYYHSIEPANSKLSRNGSKLAVKKSLHKMLEAAEEKSKAQSP